VAAIIKKAIVHLGLNLANLINFLHPQGVLIESFIMTLPENKKIMNEIILENIFDQGNDVPDISFIPYNPDCGALGAVALAIKRFLLEG